MVSAPWSRCSAAEYPNAPIPYTIDGQGDDF